MQLNYNFDPEPIKRLPQVSLSNHHSAHSHKHFCDSSLLFLCNGPTRPREKSCWLCVSRHRHTHAPHAHAHTHRFVISVIRVWAPPSPRWRWTGSRCSRCRTSPCPPTSRLWARAPSCTSRGSDTQSLCATCPRTSPKAVCTLTPSPPTGRWTHHLCSFCFIQVFSSPVSEWGGLRVCKGSQPQKFWHLLFLWAVCWRRVSYAAVVDGCKNAGISYLSTEWITVGRWVISFVLINHIQNHIIAYITKHSKTHSDSLYIISKKL